MQNYKFLEQVGEGTYGRVFKAVDIRTNDIVAIKQLFSLNQEEGVSYLALQEIKSLKFLSDCKHIVKLLDVFSEKDNNSNNDSLCLVFPFASSDLTGLLSVPSYTPPLAHVKCLFKQLLEGLSEIHKRHLMHRDIKAANLLIHHGNLVLGDLGMMTNYKQRTEFPANVVTLWYRSPELLLGAPKYGPEVDMWSAGVVLVELMTKKSPFPGFNENHQMDLIFKVLGTPDPATWPGVDALPGFKKLRKGLYKTNQLRKIFRDWDPEALDLLEKLFAPPHQRITADQALDHQFFKAEPLPSEPSQLAELPALHEFEVKGKKQPQLSSLQPHNHNTSHSHAPPEQNKKRNFYSQPQCTYPPQHEPNKQMRYNNVPHKPTHFSHPIHAQPNNKNNYNNNNNRRHETHSFQSRQNHRNNNNNNVRNTAHIFIPPTRDTDSLHLFRNGGVPPTSSAEPQSNTEPPIPQLAAVN